MVVWTGIGESQSGNSDEGYSTSYSPDIRYHYAVNGVTYTGTRIGHVGRSFANPKQAAAILERYPVNQVAPVFFNPAKPQDAVLVREAPGSNFILWAGIAILAIVIVAAFK
jgi:hypothetical protein